MALYCGLDLHANNTYGVVADERDQALFDKRLPNRLEPILNALEPFRQEVVGVAVESTFNWYWLAVGRLSPLERWLISYAVKKHADKETLRQTWMATDDPMAARAGWSLTAERVVKSPEGLDLFALLERIESEMGDAAPEVQWTMNFVLVEIGTHFPDHRERALAIGEKLGLYRDYPVSKGCTSPFAPIAINEMVSRQG